MASMLAAQADNADPLSRVPIKAAEAEDESGHTPACTSNALPNAMTTS